ncbi:MAG: hypothetical protein RBT47_07880 [Anaerolineae bacterium]|nr:hypothetical protein [Anaerolineae bacterium]
MLAAALAFLGYCGGIGPVAAQEVGYDHFIYLPVVLRSEPPITDALLNPGFEAGYDHDTFYGERPAILTPEDWVTWWKESSDDDMEQPEIVRSVSTDADIYVEPIPRIRSGKQAMQIAQWGKYQAGFYQRVAELPAGALATFSAYGHAWSCNEDLLEPVSCGDPYAYWLKVGIDPTGGEDPWAGTVVWSEDRYVYDAYEKIGPVTTTVGEGGAVTVFIFSEGKWIVKHNEAYWDDAALLVQP